MRTKDVPKYLGIGRTTLHNYRKKLGIFEETKREMSEEHLRRIIKIRNSRGNTGRQRLLETEAAKYASKTGHVKINTSDPAWIKNLKGSYNANQTVIEYLDKVIMSYLSRGETPDKTTADMMAKFQMLNIQITKKLILYEPLETDMKNKIQNGLAKYT